MESRIARQSEIISSITTIKVNFNKDSDSRKNAEYIKKRLGALDALWEEFEQNHSRISDHASEADEYFRLNTYQVGKDLYQSVRILLSSYGKSSKSTQPDGEVDELLAMQRTNFRALSRLIKSIKVENISDKWELEDELNGVQSIWKIIDAQHLKIDHILAGGDISSTRTLSRVASNLPSVQFKKQSWPHLQHLQLADPEYNVSKSIDLLLDVSIYSQIIMDGLIKGPSQAPIAQQTALGWILSGNVRTFNCHIVTNNISDLSKYWEIEDVEPSSSSSLTSEEQYCEEFYQQTTRRLDTGRYEVGIPMKPEYENQLGSSKSKAIAQFKQLERKMCNNLLFSESYKSFMSEYQQLGHMCKADNVDESKPAFYLPHHGVIKLDSTTTKLRVVFNASSKSSSASTLRQSFYMDDLLGGTNTINQARELQHQLIEMLKGAGMNLRKWSSNDPELLKDLSSDQLNSPFDFKCSESKKTLGLRWNPSTDTFSFQNPVQCRNQCVTKRQLLSEISKLFDPLGWLSPLSIRAKLLFQNAWSLKLSWDENVPQSIQDDWIHLRSDLNLIDQFIIPRYIGNTNQLYQIHAFCDASDKAYACAVYVVSKDHKGECISRLAVAKTKLAPLAKKVSLPRLELCGALLLAQLIKKVMESLSNENVEIYAWTDSMIVLGWIQGDVHRWKQFVANRIITITNIVPSSCWHHVRSEDNAADCATRGLTSQKLLNHPLWWQGPKWIIHFDLLIKEENLPPGKWALGRIQDVHPGKDNYVRVVSLKTKGDNIIKRPVNKLVLLPTNEDTVQDQAIDQGNSSNPSPPSSCQQKKSERTQRSRRGISFKSLFIHSLLFIFMLLSPVHAQSTNNHQSYNLTSLDENQAIYFDRLSNLQYIKDEWRLVVYYNMTTYWKAYRISKVTSIISKQCASLIQVNNIRVSLFN
ncbi:hypothetical protein HF086_003808 [Spodoptera exigua]|uniref:DUF5641 domain-containing protein n=1 Tax=Spodoptera exigua TaxID=7107 RepID=A0A922MWX6_SPOEX|nr:hypothetical protein HF086_003808 [Spodoptera exigua]